MSSPTLLEPGTFQASDVAVLKENADTVIDIYEDQIKELFRIEFPDQEINEAKFAEYVGNKESGDLAGAWAYFPWNRTLLHCVSRQDLFRLRTNRNRNLITEEEQHKLAATTIGVAGMSVGAGIALAAIYSGMSEIIKIADFDSIDTSNLNRLRETLLSVGKKKVELAAQHIYEVDPFTIVEQFGSGLTEDNLSEFFDTPKLGIVIDEIDDFKMKIKLRLAAKEKGIPLLMFTSLGDNILIDVERYDINPDLAPFHGLIGGGELEAILAKEIITPHDIKQLSVKLVGAEYIPTRALGSVVEMGKSLVGRPQLYSTIVTDSGLAAFVLRRIILTGKPVTGRYFVKFGDLFGLPDGDFILSAEREEILKKLTS